jgi:hypothetical protein
MTRAYIRAEGKAALAEVQREKLAKLREEKGALLAASLVGPYVLTFQGSLVAATAPEARTPAKRE